MSNPATANPFPGLRPFGLKDHPFFFGRDEQLRDLRIKLRRNRFIAVVGRSGSGKSSLVRAGLVPQLAGERQSQDINRWQFIETRPEGRPLVALARALIATRTAMLADGPLKGRDRISDETRLERYLAMLRRSSFGLSEVVAELGIARSTPVLLLVDQFEELFRYQDRDLNPHADDQARDDSQAFVQLLLSAVSAKRPMINVVITMRSDFLGDCASVPGLAEAINDSQFLVPSLSRDQWREVIVKPVEKAGGTIQPALVQRLLNEIGNAPDQLPILQHALMRTWSRTQHPAGKKGFAEAAATFLVPNKSAPRKAKSSRAEPINMTLATYEEVGGIEGALNNHAEEAYQQLDDAQKRTCMRLFKRLSTIDRDGRAVRTAVRLDLLRSSMSPGLAGHLDRVLTQFRTQSFLLPPPGDPLDNDSRVDISHEALLRCWERLSGQNELGGWIAAEASDRRIFERLRESARNYRADPANVLPPGILREANQWWDADRLDGPWAERYGGKLDDVKLLISESEAHYRREKRKARIVKLVLIWSILTTVFAGLGGVALWGWYRADSERELVDEARAAAETARAAAQERLEEVLAAREEIEKAEADLLLTKLEIDKAAFETKLTRTNLILARADEALSAKDPGLAMALVSALYQSDLPKPPTVDDMAYRVMLALRERKRLVLPTLIDGSGTKGPARLHIHPEIDQTSITTVWGGQLAINADGSFILPERSTADGSFVTEQLSQLTQFMKNIKGLKEGVADLEYPGVRAGIQPGLVLKNALGQAAMVQRDGTVQIDGTPVAGLMAMIGDRAIIEFTVDPAFTRMAVLTSNGSLLTGPLTSGSQEPWIELDASERKPKKIRFGSMGQSLILSSDQNPSMEYITADLAQRVPFNVQIPVLAAVLDEVGDRLVYAGIDGIIRTKHTLGGAPSIIGLHEGGVTDLAVIDGGLVSISSNGIVKVWDWKPAVDVTTELDGIDHPVAITSAFPVGLAASLRDGADGLVLDTGDDQQTFATGIAVDQLQDAGISDRYLVLLTNDSNLTVLPRDGRGQAPGQGQGQAQGQAQGRAQEFTLPSASASRSQISISDQDDRVVVIRDRFLTEIALDGRPDAVTDITLDSNNVQAVHAGRRLIVMPTAPGAGSTRPVQSTRLELMRYDLDQTLFEVGDLELRRAAFDSTGSRLALLDRYGAIHMIDIDRGPTPFSVLRPKGSPVRAIALSDQGKALLGKRANGDLTRWPLFEQQIDLQRSVAAHQPYQLSDQEHCRLFGRDLAACAAR